MKQRFHFTAALALALSLAPLQSARACGGNGQVPCTVAAAQYLQSTHCDSGTFRDPRNGGECWSCDGWARTLNAVNGGAACSQAGYTGTAYASYTGKPRGFDCPRGSFYDPRNWGECWSCGGWDRSASKVTASDACTHAYPEETKAARFVKNAHCSAGSFWDGRNGGECWSCPSGYNRSATAVTDASACTAQTPCAGGMIEYGGKCWTSGDCGYSDGRACTIGERIPSCNAGLKEYQGRCVPLRPGESAFLGAIGDWSKDVSKQGYAACEAAFNAIPKVNTGSPFLDAEGECGKQMSLGFSCEITKIPGQIQGVTELLRKTGLEWDRDPCASVPPGEVRAACSVLLAVGRESGDAIQCALDTAGGGALSNIDPMQVCRIEGQIGFTLAMMALGAEVADATEGAAAILKAILKVNTAIGAGDKANKLSEKIHASAACKRVSGQHDAVQTQAAASLNLPPASGFSRKPGSLTYYRFSPDGVATFGGTTIGTGWDLPTVLSGGQGVLYTVTAAGDLNYYRHDPAGNWVKSGVKAGSGWSGFKRVLSGGNGDLYAVNPSGELLLYKYDMNGANLWSKQIGTGWSDAAQVVASGDGILYIVSKSGDLLYYRHDDAGNWSVSGQKIGTGWGDLTVYGAGQGRLFTVNKSGALEFFEHSPTGAWMTLHKPAGTGWDIFSNIIVSPSHDGLIYGVVR